MRPWIKPRSPGPLYPVVQWAGRNFAKSAGAIEYTDCFSAEG